MVNPKVLFIVPSFSEHDQFRGEINKNIKTNKKKKELRVYPYLGVCYLMAGLKHNQRIDYDIDLIDAPAENFTLNELIREIKRKNPAIIAITITTFTLRAAKLVIEGCRKEIPSAKIIIGGVHINHSPEDFRYFGADYGLRGDCEFTIKPLVEAILDNKSVKKIPGIMYMEGNKFIMDKNPPIIENLDSIPFPDRSKLKAENYIFPLFNKKFTTIIGSRGCPYHCVYCGLPYNRKYKKRSVENIIQELKQLQTLGYEFVSFSDDIFTLDNERIFELCREIKRNKISLKWGCSTRADCVTYPLLKALKDAGCLDIRFGIESGNERIRKEIITKKIPDEQFVKSVNWAKKARLVVTGFFLFGHPTETEKNMIETMEFAKKINVDYVSFGIVVPIPSSGTFIQALKEKKIDKYIWRDVINGAKEVPFYSPEKISLDFMKDLRMKANRSFYLRPKYILTQLIQIRSLSDFLFRAKWGVNLLFNRGKD